MALLLAAPAAAEGAGQAVAAERPRASATRASEPIRLDGVLDEAAWVTASPVGPLVQREPLEGQPATEETEVRVLYDAENLYFGVRCRDREPGRVIATQLIRDAELEVDDTILVILDPFFDSRNGFFFQVNPAGARADGQVANNAEHPNQDWDGIWDAAARIDEAGWAVEIAIPFKTLRFKPGQQTWGLNLERHIKRRNETDRWASPRRDVWITNLAQAGLLDGLQGVHQGRGLDIRPFFTGGRENREGTVQAGIDVFKNLTPNLNASVSVNTDFAETEVDARQINLTRFPLFFPEKRAFFLEGAGVFEVAGANASFGHAELLPFFSRRIGLLANEPVPVLFGAKVIGRQAGFNIGALDVQTRDQDENPRAGQNLFVARVSRNVLRESSVGVIVTRGNPAGTGDNTLVGADARLSTSTFRGGKNLSLDLFVLRTDDQETEAADYAAGFRIDYPNDLWDVVLSWKQIGEAFRPALGFVPRPGIRSTSAGISFQPRPRALGIRQLFFELRPGWITNLQNRVENWNVFVAPLNLETESGERLEFNYEPEFEHLPEPFEIEDGVVIPAGSYRWTRWGIEMQTADKRPWVASVEYGWGGFYDGSRRNLELGLTLKPNGHLSFRLDMERNNVSFAQADFVTQVFSIRGDYNFSPDVSWANLLQYDTESRILGVQSRFRWILRPGNDLFLVLNRGWYRSLDGRYRREFDKGTLKLQYTFRL